MTDRERFGPNSKYVEELFTRARALPRSHIRELRRTSTLFVAAETRSALQEARGAARMLGRTKELRRATRSPSILVLLSMTVVLSILLPNRHPDEQLFWVLAYLAAAVLSIRWMKVRRPICQAAAALVVCDVLPVESFRTLSSAWTRVGGRLGPEASPS